MSVEVRCDDSESWRGQSEVDDGFVEAVVLRLRNAEVLRDAKMNVDSPILDTPDAERAWAIVEQRLAAISFPVVLLIIMP